MQGTIIENLSGKKLFVLVVLLIIAQVVCFLIGGLIGESRSQKFILAQPAYFFYMCVSVCFYCYFFNYFFLLIFCFTDAAPTPASSQNILGTACQDVRINGSEPGAGKWFYSRGKGACTPVDMHKFTYDSHHQAYQVVYTFQVSAGNRYVGQEIFARS